MDPFDCEAFADGLILQPVNAWSSLALVVSGLVVWRLGFRWQAISVGVAGAGSFWFHAAPSTVANVIHDVGLYAALAAGVLRLVWRLRDGSIPYVALVVGAIGLVFWSQSRTGMPLCDPDSLVQGHAVWHVAAAWAFAVLFVETEGHGH